MRLSFPAFRPLFLLPLLLIACGDSPSPVPSRTFDASRPNVLLIVLDTTRGDRCSVNGYAKSTSPHLVRFAKKAVTYRDAWTPADWTGPAHSSLFTGLRPEHHGFFLGNLTYLPKRPVTLAEKFTEAGYRTASFSNNPFVTASFGLTRGFATSACITDVETNGRVSARWAHDLALAEAVAARREGQPFFVFVNDMEPHLPYEPTSPAAARFLPKDTSPEEIRAGNRFTTDDALDFMTGRRAIGAREWEVLSALYDAEIHDLDAELGRFFDQLAREGLLENTLVIVVGDHGENLGDHGLADHMAGLHRSLLHVPLIVRFPPKFAPGTVVDDVVRLEDLFPTILAVAGLTVPEGIDGLSLLGNVEGRLAVGLQGRPPQSAFRKQRGWTPDLDISRLDVSIRSIYDGRHHLIRYSDGREELYDVDADPGEIRNLVSESPPALERMRTLLAEYRDGPK